MHFEKNTSLTGNSLYFYRLSAKHNGDFKDKNERSKSFYFLPWLVHKLATISNDATAHKGRLFQIQSQTIPLMFPTLSGNLLMF